MGDVTLRQILGVGLVSFRANLNEPEVGSVTVVLIYGMNSRPYRMTKACGLIRASF